MSKNYKQDRNNGRPNHNREKFEINNDRGRKGNRIPIRESTEITASTKKPKPDKG
jgi:hypothetical protein